MNICFISGKIISDIDYKFVINNKKIKSVVIFEFKLNSNTRIPVIGHNEIADICYSRLRKYDKELNVLLGVASSINANTNRVDKNSDYLVMLKESSKVNLMDIERVKNEYNIKSKTILKLIDRLEKFEKENINKIDMILGKK